MKKIKKETEPWIERFIEKFYVDRFQELPFESALKLQQEIIDFINKEKQYEKNRTVRTYA